MKRLMLTLLVTMAAVFGPLQQTAHAMGELTYLPSYYTKIGRWDLGRFGLYIQEQVFPKWDYVTWTGGGRVFSDGGSIPVITWYATQHDLVRELGDRVRLGGGAGVNYSKPANYTDVDVHMRLSVKLW